MDHTNEFQEQSFSKPDEVFTLLSDNSTEEMKTIFEKSIIVNNNGSITDSTSPKLICSFENNQINVSHHHIAKGDVTYANNLDLIDKYTQKLLELQEKLDENIVDHKLEKAKIFDTNVIVNKENIEKSNKILFKELYGFKKDVVMKKLLKTIDLMNQELNKRDKLILNMEKENIILKSENKQKSSKSELKLDKEIDRLKREIINERTEKEIIEAKTEFFRNEIKVCKSNFDSDLIVLNNNFNTKENNYEQTIQKLELEIKDKALTIDSLNEERNTLIKTIDMIQEEKSGLIHQNEIKQNSENNFDDLKSKYNEMKTKFDLISYENFEKQNKIQYLLKDAETKATNKKKCFTMKSDELKRVKQQLNLSQERVKYLQTKSETEIQLLKKQCAKEYNQLKISNEQTISNNAELSRSNGELRKKNKQFETDLKELNEKCFVNKQNADLFNRQRKELKEEYDRTTSEMREQILNLERLRDDYLKKNISQQKSIEQMLSQINSFQTEFEELLKRNTHLQEKIKKLFNIGETYKNKYNDIKRAKKQDDVKLAQRTELTNISETMEVNLIKKFIKELRTEENHDDFLADTSRVEEKSSYKIKFQRNTSIETSNIQLDDLPIEILVNETKNE